MTENRNTTVVDMAVFDGRSSKVVLDDTQTLSCTLGAAENVQGHTVREKNYYYCLLFTFLITFIY